MNKDQSLEAAYQENDVKITEEISDALQKEVESIPFDESEVIELSPLNSGAKGDSLSDWSRRIPGLNRRERRQEAKQRIKEMKGKRHG